MADQPQPTKITPELSAQAERLSKIFFPSESKRRMEWFKKTPDQKSAKLVHYTTAESALAIIKTKRFWMRNTVCMSDYSEVLHGFNLFNAFFQEQTNLKKFTDSLDSCHAGVAQEALDTFNQQWQNSTIQMQTYVACLSEHDDSEDVHGRLSMWRAFGASPSRVAIVLNIPSDTLASVSLGIQFSPVSYLSETAAHNEIAKVIDNVLDDCAYLREIDRAFLVQLVYRMLVTGVVGWKHEAFHEEREWRAIYQPKIWSSPLMGSSTRVIAGIPQIVYEVPMDSSKSPELADLNFAAMFDHLIVGPTPYPWPIYEAFVDALTKAGVTDAGKRLVPSGIPIRA